MGKEVSIAADGKVDGVEVTWTGEAPGAGKLVITEVAGTGKVKIGEIEFTNPGKTSGGEGVFDHEVYLCEAFADQLYRRGKNGNRGEDYDQCGMMISPDNCNMDPYMCGDDLVFPGVSYNYNVTEFLKNIQPPLFGDNIGDDDSLNFVVWPGNEQGATPTGKTWASVKAEGYQCFNAAPGNSFPVLSLLAALAVSFAMFW